MLAAEAADRALFAGLTSPTGRTGTRIVTHATSAIEKCILLLRPRPTEGRIRRRATLYTTRLRKYGDDNGSSASFPDLVVALGKEGVKEAIFHLSGDGLIYSTVDKTLKYALYAL